MSTVNDLGYRPYRGKRLPPSNNAKVMLRHGLKRAWSSWLIKVAAFVGWLPLVIFMALVGGRFFFSTQSEGVSSLVADEASQLVGSLVHTQTWFFVSLVTLGAGASAISEDLSKGAFPFYFAKPMTRPQYLLGRIGAVAFWCFILTFVPAALLIGLLLGVVAETERLATLAIFLPAFAQSTLIALSLSGASIGMSALSRSRAFTMSAWMFLFIIPHIVAVIVEGVAEWPWLRMLSLPALLEATCDGLLGTDEPNPVPWTYAVAMLGALGGCGALLALERLRKTEVVG